MIEFKGKLSKKCKRYIQIQESKIHVKIFTLTFIVLSPFLGFLFNILDPLPAILIYIACYAVSVAMSFLFPLFTDYDKSLPNQITICVEEDVIKSISQQQTFEMQISNIDKIIDMGDWYLIHFDSGPNRPPRFVCQKDLITSGSLDNFEELFKEKITKK